MTTGTKFWLLQLATLSIIISSLNALNVTQAVCPTCVNGGKCNLKTMTCKCPIPFKGDTCADKYCEDPPKIEGSIYKPKGIDEAEMTCDTNHHLVLKNSDVNKMTKIDIVCVNKKWTLSHPNSKIDDITCKRLTCTALSVKNGQSLPRGYDGMVRNFTCHYGYKSEDINGTVEVECINGEWKTDKVDMKAVACKSTSCEQPPQLASQTAFVAKYCNANCKAPSLWDANYEVVCNIGYRLPTSNATRSHLQCNTNKWYVEKEDIELTSALKCKPYCSTPCKNGGTCSAPDTCNCTTLWTGKYCEIATCTTNVPAVGMADVRQGPQGPFLNCKKGHSLEGGKTATRLECKTGVWVPTDIASGKIPNACTPIPPNNNTKCGTDKTKFPKVNNGIVLSNERGVISAQCYSGFYFPSSYENEIPLECDILTNEWKTPDKNGCVGFCENSCENGGVCVGNNVCRCTPETGGKRCEVIHCTELPRNQNAAIHIKDSIAVANCRQGYEFPDHTTTAQLKCVSGSWEYPSTFKDTQRVQCSPICKTKCQNGGWCYTPNTCRCQPGFTGKFCEIKTECLNFIPGVPHTITYQVNQQRFAATCKNGYRSTGTADIVDVECTAGMWVAIDKKDIDVRLKCVPVCNLPCQNGGTCIGPDMCRCTTEYTGNQCEQLQPIGGCPAEPPYVPNGLLIYTPEEGTLSCDRGYFLPNIEKNLPMTCSRGRWIFGNYITHPYSAFCTPNCTIPCKNGGTCIEADTCACTPEYDGAYCQHFIEKSCDELPIPMPNSVLLMEANRDSKSFGHFIVCAKGYQFRNGLQREEIECANGVWKFPTSIHTGELLSCEPICENPCVNGGVCVAPDTCVCAEPYTGKTCQVLKTQLCWKSPSSVANAIVYFSPVSSSAICQKGYQLEDGKTQINFTCNAGEWDIPDTNVDYSACKPVCSKGCANGGKCIAPNTCKCKEGFTGERCEIYVGKKCDVLPNGVLHGTIYYSGDKARLKCHPGYALKSGSIEITFLCTKDKWLDELNSKEFGPEFKCLPLCDRPCLNTGTCIAPNVCKCPYEKIGDVCQYDRCMKDPPGLQNAVLTFSSDFLEAVFRCQSLHRLPWAGTGIKYKCINGQWEVFDKSLPKLTPDVFCRPICDRPCMNGGYCIRPRVCKCAEGFFGDQCERRYDTTIKGEKCLFPFRYNGGWFYGCIDDDYHRPWCATSTNIHGLITAWDVCVADLGTSAVIVTEDMQVCEFPFTYKGKTYNRCTMDGRDKLWCATKTTGANIVSSWGFCNPRWGSNIVLITSTGNECLGNFDHYGKVITGCVDDPRKPWCTIKMKDIENKDVVTDICLADWGSYYIPITHTGKVCKFPFKLDGADQWTCVSKTDTKKSWCATKTDSNNVILETDECPPYYPHHNTTVKPQISVIFPSLGFININIQTLSGYTCSLPFLYKNKQINGCTYMDSEDPWCAVEVDAVGNIIRKDLCPPNWDIRDTPPEIETPCEEDDTVIMTTSNLPCISPFKHNDKLVYGCTTSENKSSPWCATKVNKKKEPLETSECPINWSESIQDSSSVLGPPKQHTTKANMTITTVDEKVCQFPVTYKGTEYKTCFYEDSIFAWCPTALDSHGFVIDWDYCKRGWEKAPLNVQTSVTQENIPSKIISLPFKEDQVYHLHPAVIKRPIHVPSKPNSVKIFIPPEYHPQPEPDYADTEYVYDDDVDVLDSLKQASGFGDMYLLHSQIKKEPISKLPPFSLKPINNMKQIDGNKGFYNMYGHGKEEPARKLPPMPEAEFKLPGHIKKEFTDAEKMQLTLDPHLASSLNSVDSLLKGRYPENLKSKLINVLSALNQYKVNNVPRGGMPIESFQKPQNSHNAPAYFKKQKDSMSYHPMVLKNSGVGPYGKINVVPKIRDSVQSWNEQPSSVHASNADREAPMIPGLKLKKQPLYLMEKDGKQQIVPYEYFKSIADRIQADMKQGVHYRPQENIRSKRKTEDEDLMQEELKGKDDHIPNSGGVKELQESQQPEDIQVEKSEIM